MRKIRSSLAILSLIAATRLSAQVVELSYNGARSYSLTERSDLRKYENGKYVGMTSREVRSFISPADSYDAAPRYARDSWFDGNFYVTEERKDNARNTSDGIHDSIPSVFHIAPNGELTMHEDHGFPSFRSFPAFPSKKVGVGDSWTAQAERAVDPKGDGTMTRLKLEVRYTLEGEGVLDGREVYKIAALWQTLYGMSWRDTRGDPDLVGARGGHKASIMVLKATGEPVLVTDSLDETFVYRDKTEIGYKGTISLFIRHPPRMDSDKIIAALENVATVKESAADAGEPGKDGGSKSLGGGSSGSITSARTKRNAHRVEDSGSGGHGSGAATTGGRTARTETEGEKTAAPPKIEPNARTGGGMANPVSRAGTSGAESVHSNSARSNQAAKTLEMRLTAAKNDMIVEETAAGIRLTVQNVQFQADSAELVLGAEGNRLDDIASALRLADGAHILIEGHTAATGRPAAEYALSQERARKIANELASRGINKETIIVRGWGGTKPIAPNTNNAGKALNRRVEITILR